MTYHCLQFDDLNPGKKIMVQYRDEAGEIVDVRGEFRGWSCNPHHYYGLLLRRNGVSWSIPTAVVIGVSEVEGVNT